MALSASTIATAIASLSVSGVSIKNLTTASIEGYRDNLPVLAPDIDNFGGDIQVEGGSGPLSFGTNTTRFWMMTRTLGYIYFHAPLGSNRGNPYQFMSSICDKRDAIIEALLELSDATDTDIIGVTGGKIAIVSDMAGNQYHGFTLAVQTREKVNNP